MGGTAYVGTSGFAYPGWKGSFYPPRLPGRAMLAHYATRLPAVEINYTFRRDPSPATVASWRDATPDSFRFAVKAPMRLTHFWPLDPPEDALSRFLELIGPLDERLGCVLFQHRATFAADRGKLERFLDRLPASLPAAFEFRHPSWDEERDVVAGRGAAWVVTETEDAPPGPLSEGGFVYVRLRRTDYDARRLGAWARRLRPALADRDAFVFFKHEEGDRGPAWAADLLRRVGRGPGG